MAEGLGSISGWGTMTLNAKRHSQKKKKKGKKRNLSVLSIEATSPLSLSP